MSDIIPGTNVRFPILEKGRGGKRTYYCNSGCGGAYRTRGAAVRHLEERHPDKMPLLRWLFSGGKGPMP